MVKKVSLLTNLSFPVRIDEVEVNKMPKLFTSIN